MFFGPFGFGYGMGNQQPNPLFQQQQPGFVHNQNLFGFQQPQQQQQNNGFFNQFANFMNPFFQTNQNRRQPPPQQEQARPSFFRRNKKDKKDERMNSAAKIDPLNSNTGMFWKNKGNEAFQKGNYIQAIQMYSKAIQLNNTESIFFSNRAQAYKKLGKLEQALKDAQEAIELDSSNARGHILAGQCLCQFGKKEDNPRKLQNGITRLTRALTLSCKKKVQIQKQASKYIYMAKKVLFYIQFNQLRNSRIQAIKQFSQYLQKDASLTPEQKQKKLQDFVNASNQKIIFSIPDYLICKITLDLMEDPVVIDSGQIYERSAIQEHIEHNGRTDPFTRQPIKGPLYSCVGIKKAIQDFLDRNPWAYEYSQGENYKNIQF